MSDRPIQVGDLVQVVRPYSCCGNLHDYGNVGIVRSMERAIYKCEFCLFSGRKVFAYGNNNSVPIAGIDRLKRIPPLSELEGTRTDEPTKETA